MKRIEYTEKVTQTPKLHVLAEKGTDLLEEIIGPSAELVDAEWDRTVDDKGQPLLILRLSDWTGSASTVVALWEFDQPSYLRLRLNRLYGDLLQVRSHKMLEELRKD